MNEDFWEISSQHALGRAEGECEEWVFRGEDLELEIDHEQHVFVVSFGPSLFHHVIWGGTTVGS